MRYVLAETVAALPASALYLCRLPASALPCFRKAAMKTAGKVPRRDGAAVQLYWLVLCAALMATAALMASVGKADATNTV